LYSIVIVEQENRPPATIWESLQIWTEDSYTLNTFIIAIGMYFIGLP